MALTYEVVRKFVQGTEKTIAKFSEKSDAQEYMESKAGYDCKMQVKSIILLLHEGVEIGKIVSADFKPADPSSYETTVPVGGSFSPNPLSTAPQPGGMKSSFTNTKKDTLDEDI